MFTRNFNVNLEAPETLVASADIQYPCMMVHVEVLRQFDRFSAEVGITISENLNFTILDLNMYFFPVNDMSKQNSVMCHILKKLHSLKVIRYTYCMIDLN